MKEINVYKKILKGALEGIVIGVIVGLGIPTAMNWNNIVSNKDKIVNAFSEKVIETFTDENPQIKCDSLEDFALRFHIRANSNNDEDIALKMLVRDAVFETIRGEISNMDSQEEVISYLSGRLESIEEMAQAVIYENGFNYDVSAYISEDYFPIRQYGDITIPAGYYKALRIDIGEAKGENFWCLLYPAVCFTMDSVTFVSKEDEGKIKQELTDEDYEHLFVKRDVPKENVKFKFKLLELLDF